MEVGGVVGVGDRPLERALELVELGEPGRRPREFGGALVLVVLIALWLWCRYRSPLSATVSSKVAA